MKNEIIKIGNHDISAKVFKNQRVVTFKDIDLVHERPDGTAKRNFNTNENKFIEGEDFFKIPYSEFSTKFVPNPTKGGNPNIDVVLLTQQGYLMLVKSLTDDLAWEVQRKLVKSYFQTNKPLSAMEMLELQFQATKEISQKVDEVNQDLQDFKQDMPILGVEESKITSAVSKKGVQCLGGKHTESYKDSSLRKKVYSDIYRQLKREFGVASYKAIKRSQCDKAVSIIENYEMPFVLEEQIRDTNAQMHLDTEKTA